MQESQSFHAFFGFIAVFIAVAVNFMLVYQTDINPWIVLGIMILNSLVALMMLFTKLKTSYNDTGIELTYFPLIIKKKIIPWSDVEYAYVRQYAPIREYGGWGLRYGKKGKAYNTKGNMGLQLEMKNGKKLLIGTQKPEELRLYIHNLEARGIVKTKTENN